ncbi:hypothetical protein NHH03_08965 [Stieleria sp. TO1_6]|uniref:hypothetical protein n=1 Tax=Stieleria tagensis TaxID=2956795 RepID=UPI00209B4D66|nr:hypothetical protein [Stieleria tagensis]MCO8121864.1 hypothetical protein [Stieleria tagensis]
MSDTFAAEARPERLNTPTLYRRSGRVSPTSIVIAALLLIPLGLLLGALYSAAVVYLPFIKLRGIVTFFFGALLGAIAGKLCYRLKYRNGVMVALTTLGFAAVAYYASWAVHPAMVVGPGQLGDGFVSTMLLGFDPLVIMAWMKLIFTEGIWAIGNNGGALSGWFAVLVWLIEAGLIVGAALVTGMGSFGNRPFCETCHRWNDETEELAILPVSVNDPAWQQIRNGHFDALKKLQIAADSEASYVELRLADCPTCDESDYLSAIGITLTMDDGQIKKIETPVFQHLSVSRDQREEIVAFAAAMAEAVEEMNAAEADEQVEAMSGQAVSDLDDQDIPDKPTS